MRKTLLVAVLLPVWVAGCSFGDLMQEKRIEYKSAGKLPPLEVPPDLTRPGRDDRYQIPDATPSSSATFSAYNADRKTSPKSGSTEVLPDAGKIQIQRAGSERWLLVPEPPEKLWPVVKEFWQENGFLLKVEMPEAGVMETDWAENRAKIPSDPLRNLLGKVMDQAYSTGERDKFRTRLERGPEPNTTEIFISHRGMVETITNSKSGQGGYDNTIWQPRNGDSELEAEFLRRLMVRLGTEDARAKAVVASGKPQDTRARLTKGADGTGTLVLNEPFDRAWRRVGVALDRVGFTVEDRDRSKGFYFVRYIDPATDAGKDSGGILSKLAFWRDTSKPDPNKQPQYRVLVKDDSASSEVQVLTKDGGVENSDTSRRILTLLYDQLK